MGVGEWVSGLVGWLAWVVVGLVGEGEGEIPPWRTWVGPAG